MQAIAAISSRIEEIQGRMADLGLTVPAQATDAVSGASGLTGTDATDPAHEVAFQGRLQAAMGQLNALNPDAATSGLAGMTSIAGLSGMTGMMGSFPGMAGMAGSLPGTAGSLPLDALTMAQRLGLDRSALASSSIPSVAALAGTGTTTATSGIAGADVTGKVSGTRNAQGVPAELAVYGNGKIPAAALSELPSAPGHRLWAPAAASFEKMMAAAKADGVTIGVTDSYRPLSVQEDLVRRKGLYSQGGLAAVPGTSQHGWGAAVDLRLDSEAQSWMRANGGRFGFVEDTPREPWHWTFKG